MLAAYGEIGQCLPEYCNLLDFGVLPKLIGWVERMRALPHHDALMDQCAPLFAYVRKGVAELEGSAKL